MPTELQLKDLFLVIKKAGNGYYLDPHHISGNKTNNNPSNLKCLCSLCHSNVDDNHRRNFSVGLGQKRVNDFISIHKDKLIEIGNPYL